MFHFKIFSVMKKNLFWVALAAITMASCTSDELTIADQQQQEANSLGLMPINLSLTSATASVTQTRGTGTVGSTNAATNKFKFEDIYVLMMDVTPDSTWKYTNCGGSLGEQFNNTFFCRPQVTAADGIYSLEYNGFTGGAGGALKYYPMHGSSDFFGYYIDNAADNLTAEGNPAIAYNADETALVLPFTINGSQDIMAGKATNYADTIGFSNTTARQNVVPRIDMKHMLTRFTFEIIAGDDGKDSLFIDTISVFSKAQGILKVAMKDTQFDYNDSTALLSLIEWDETQDSVAMVLDTLSAATAPSFENGKPMVERCDTLFIGAEGSTYKVGDALFVQPGKTQYTLKLKVHQLTRTGYDDVLDTPIIEEQTAEQTLAIKKADDSAFERAKSYHIKIKVYSMREIEIETMLEQWEDAGEIEVDTDY